MNTIYGKINSLVIWLKLNNLSIESQRLSKVAQNLNQLPSVESLKALEPYSIVMLLTPSLDSLTPEYSQLFENSLRQALIYREKSFDILPYEWIRALKILINSYPEYAPTFYRELLNNLHYFISEIPQQIIMDAWNSMEKKEDKFKFADNIFSLRSYTTMYKRIPEVIESMYIFLIDQYPHLYFKYGLEKFFTKDKWGDGPTESDPEEIAEQVSIRQPREFFILGLNIKFPHLERQAVTNLVSSDKMNIHAINNDESHIGKIISNMLFFFKNGLHLKYFKLSNTVINRVVNDRQLESYLLFNARDDDFIKTDYGYEIISKIAYRIIDEERYEDFFNVYRLNKIFESEAIKIIENLIDQNNFTEIFKIFALKNLYPTQARKAGIKILDLMEETTDIGSLKQLASVFSRNILYIYTELRSRYEKIMKEKEIWGRI